MTKELAKTLTTALVQFIDRERPEGTMCCSNIDCENIRAAFEEGEYDCVEAFIKKKLSRLTKFELSLRQIIEVTLSDEVPNGSGGTMSWAVALSDDDIKKLAPKILTLAREQFKPEIDAEIEKAYKTQDNVVFRKGWEQGKEEVLKDLEKPGKVHCKSYDKGFQDGETETMADLERTYFSNPDKLPKWLKDDIARKELNAHTKGYNKGYKDAEKLCNTPSFIPYTPLYQSRPLCYEPGGTCTNPQMDCINCPRWATGGGSYTASGTSTSTLHGNTSATDGKEHNPSFID